MKKMPVGYDYYVLVDAEDGSVKLHRNGEGEPFKVVTIPVLLELAGFEYLEKEMEEDVKDANKNRN